MSSELIKDPEFQQKECLEKLEQKPESSRKIVSLSRISSSYIKSTPTQIFCNLFKSFVGVGILSLSYGYKETGLILGNISIIICSFFTFWSLSIVVKIADHLNIRITSLSQLFHVLLGKWGLYCGQFNVFICLVGVCAVYVSLFGTFFKNVFCFANFELFCNHYIFDIILCLIIIVPLSLVKTLTKYNTWSSIANFFIISSLFIILVISLNKISEDKIQGTKLYDFEKLPSFFGISIFAIECVGIVLEMRDSMNEPKKFQYMLIMMFALVTFMYTSLSSIFYMAFGENIQELVIFNVSISTVLGFIVQLFYAIGLCITFPLQLFPIFMMIEGFFSSNDKDLFLINKEINSKIKKYNRIKFYIARVILVILIITVSYLIPEIASFINMIGAIGFTFLGMIFPVILGEIYRRKEPNCDFYPLYSRIINCIGMLLGIIGGTFAFISSIKSFMKV